MFVQSLISFFVSTEFTKKCLVILRYCKEDIIFQALTSLQNFGKKWFQKQIHSVVIIPHRRYGHYYIVEGLSKSPHFSMGAKGVATLKKTLEAKGIEVTHQLGDVKYNCAHKIEQSGIYGTSSFPETYKRADHEIGYQSLMLALSKEIWRPLLMVRAHYIYAYLILLSELMHP